MSCKRNNKLDISHVFLTIFIVMLLGVIPIAIASDIQKENPEANTLPFYIVTIIIEVSCISLQIILAIKRHIQLSKHCDDHNKCSGNCCKSNS